MDLGFGNQNQQMGNQALVTWAEPDDTKSMDVFHEWHEHCDM